MRNRKMVALVTGSAGFIGSHLCKALENHDDIKETIRFDIDNENSENILNEYNLQYYSPDIVFHLAAETKVKHDFTNPPTQTVITNAYGTYKLLQAFPRTRFVLASSVHCQANQSVYAASKLAAEALVEAYTNMKLVDGVSIRLTSCVGKSMTHGVVKDIMEKLCGNSPTLDLIGVSPGSVRPFLHVTDAVNAMIEYGINKDDNGIFAISTEDEICILDVATIVMDTMNIHKNIKWAGTSSEWLGDVKKLTPIEHRANDFQLKYPTCKEAIVQAVKDNL